MLLLALLFVGAWGVSMSTDSACDPRGSTVVCAESVPPAERYRSSGATGGASVVSGRFGHDFGGMRSPVFAPSAVACITSPDALAGAACGVAP